MSDILVEVCCGSADDVIESAKAGADRVELNACLFEGGLTPSVGELIVAKRETNMKIMTMVRPREGGFCYTQTEFKTALCDAEMLLKNGSDGIVFGFLKSDGTIDVEHCKEMVKLAGSKQTVFHRAIDVVPDWKYAVDVLCDLGVTRILTSGQSPSVFEGAQTVREMIIYAHGRIEVLPGAGIRYHNVSDIVAKTGCSQVHVSPHKACFDTSTANNGAIHFGGALYPPEDRFSVVDKDAVASIRGMLK